MTETWEKFADTPKREYYVSTNGEVLSYSKKHHCERKIKPFPKSNKSHKVMMIKINGEEKMLKYVVMGAFAKGFKNSAKINIIHKDGNPENCRFSNLEIVSKSDVCKVTGAMSKSKAVRVVYPDGTVRVFSSVRKASKELFVSYQTVLDYINRKPKHSLLEGYKIKYLEAENEV